MRVRNIVSLCTDEEGRNYANSPLSVLTGIVCKVSVTLN